MGKFPIHITDKSFTAFIDGAPYQTDRSNPNWEAIKRMVNDPDVTAERLIDAIKPITAVAAALQGAVDVEVVGGEVLVNGEVVATALTARVLDIITEGMDPAPWVTFVQNVYANPFVAAREELYLFLEKHEMPITPDGCFLAYKIVDEDYVDIHTRKISNRVGETVVMPGGREAVDANRRNVCSVGLHFCSKGYLPSYGVGQTSHVMVVKINPADVVSIPTDYSYAKGRTWRYEVVGEISRELAGAEGVVAD